MRRWVGLLPLLCSCELLLGDYPGPANYVFVTSKPWQIGGGVASADTYCAQLASAASLPGHYRAWLSTTDPSGGPGVSALSRLSGASGWVRTDGKPFSASLASLAKNQILYPVLLDENGHSVSADPDIATGTHADFSPSMFNANNWTRDDVDFDVGDAFAGYEIWTYDHGRQRVGAHRIYCFGIDLKASISLAPAKGRLVFITSSDFGFSPGTDRSVDKADAQCNAEAQKWGAQGKRFLALLSTTTTAAAVRMNVNGLPWVRPDGVQVLANATDLLKTPVPLLAPIGVHLDGSSSGDSVWTGAVDPNSPSNSSGSENCNDWAPSSATTGISGLGAESDARFFDFYSSPDCENGASVYCLEQ